MKKTAKDKLQMLSAATDLVRAFTPGPNLFDVVHFMADTELNSCPKCKTYISDVLKEEGVLPKNCPYCGAVMDDDKN